MYVSMRARLCLRVRISYVVFSIYIEVCVCVCVCPNIDDIAHLDP